MSLTALQIKEIKPSKKDQKLSDGEGMYFLVKANGSKYWRLDYRFGGKRKTLAIGVYPQVSLKEAREKRFEAKKLLSDGVARMNKRRHESAMKRRQPLKKLP